MFVAGRKPAVGADHFEVVDMQVVGNFGVAHQLEFERTETEFVQMFNRLELARPGNNLSRTTVLTEKNETINGAGDKPNQHDILTDSQPDGTAFADAADHTCKNYTSSAEDGSAQAGYFDRTGGGNTSWNSAHASKGCGQENLVKTGGAGLSYCFTIN